MPSRATDEEKALRAADKAYKKRVREAEEALRKAGEGVRVAKVGDVTLFADRAVHASASLDLQAETHVEVKAYGTEFTKKDGTKVDSRELFLVVENSSGGISAKYPPSDREAVERFAQKIRLASGAPAVTARAERDAASAAAKRALQDTVADRSEIHAAEAALSPEQIERTRRRARWAWVKWAAAAAVAVALVVLLLPSDEEDGGGSTVAAVTSTASAATTAATPTTTTTSEAAPTVETEAEPAPEPQRPFSQQYLLAMDDDAIKLDDLLNRLQDGEAVISQIEAVKKRITDRANTRLVNGAGSSIGSNQLTSAAAAIVGAAQRNDLPRLAQQHNEIAEARGRLAEEFAGK